MGDLLEHKERSCPSCGSKDVTLVGSAPDGKNLNLHYDCNDCKLKYEEAN